MKRWNGLNENLKEVMDYANGVCDGSIVANEYRIKACQRFLDDLQDERWDFITSDAEFVIGIIELTICHEKGQLLDGTELRGTPFFLMPFHKFIVYNLVGFKMAGTKINRFTECLIFIPRKNVKTTFAGALAYALGLLWRRSGSSIYIVAADSKQAMQTFNFLEYNIKRMKEDAKDHGGAFHIIDNNNEHSIEAAIGTGFFRLDALAANPDAQDSFNCNLAIADEIHAFKKPKQYNLFKEAMKAYSNKLMIGISTAGDDPNSFLAQKVTYCKKILDKEVENDRYFIFICEADYSVDENGAKFLDFTNPRIQEMANPAYGQSIRPDELMEGAMEALNDPQQRKDYFAKSLNVFTDAIDTYFDMMQVTSSDEKYNWTLEELAKLPIKWYGGADLSKMHDLTGATIYGTYKDVDITISHAFIPRAIAHKKADEDNIPVFWWEEMGWLTMCNGAVVEYEDVVKWFIHMKKMGFKLKWTGYDRKYAREFVMKMKKAGFKMRDQSQRPFEKTEAFREIERKVIKQQFYYLHNKAFEYCISNVKAIEDSDEFVRFQKVMPTQRIDLFDATVIACKQKLIANEKSANAAAFLE